MAKVLQLTAEEKEYLSNRINLKNQYDYVAKLIETEAQAYVENVVKKRLGLSFDDTLEISIEQGTATIKEESKEEDVQSSK